MHTNRQAPLSTGEVDLYGELVFGEVVDDEPGPRTDPPPTNSGPGPDRAQAARRVADCARTVARAVAGQTLPGLRNALALARHWLSVGYMSDDEIRRRIVNRQLEAYTAQRNDARTAIRSLEKRLKKLLEEAADYGLVESETAQVKRLTRDIARRRAGLAVLEMIPFQPIQPTPEQIRRARTLAGLLRFALAVPVVGGIAAAAALDPVESLLALVPAFGAGGWWLTHHPVELTERPIPEDLLLPELAAPTHPMTASGGGPTGHGTRSDLKPYPLAQATSPEEVAEALRRAIVHEGGDIGPVTEVTQEPWGWSARVEFNTGSPDDLNKDDTYKGLITLLKLRRNGLLIEGEPDSGDACMVRVLQRSPFTPELVGTVPYRAPLSMSITDSAEYGVAMDATPLVFSLAGLMLLMVADSGGGKSGIMLSMAEVVTACRDAVAFNIDPAGTGVGALGPAITLNACMDDKAITATLQFLLTWCSARARQRARYGWGNKWRVSREHPAICVFVDEWAQLSDKAKRLLIRLLLIGRKEGIWVFGGSQFGTKDWLGEAIGPKLSAKLLGACRRVDVTELLGGGALAEGYRADLIRAATHTERNEAGQIYAQGLPGLSDRPVRYQMREITDEYAARVGAERVATGLPDLTLTIAEAGLTEDWLDLLGKLNGGGYAEDCEEQDQGEVPRILLILREAFIREGEPPFLTLNQVHRHLRAEDAGRWGKWDDRDDTGRLRELGKALSRALSKSGVALSSERISELDGGPRGYYLAAVKQALAAVI